MTFTRSIIWKGEGHFLLQNWFTKECKKYLQKGYKNVIILNIIDYKNITNKNKYEIMEGVEENIVLLTI